MPDEVNYQFTFTGEQARALWDCIQTAPVPRGRTDALAASFVEQLNAQSAAIAAANQSKANGGDHVSPS